MAGANLGFGNAFSWTVNLLNKTLINLFIEFLGYTNEQITGHNVTQDISMLDETVLHALDINESERQMVINQKESTLSFLENLIEEQKRKRKEKNIDIMKRISLGEKVDLS